MCVFTKWLLRERFMRSSSFSIKAYNERFSSLLFWLAVFLIGFRSTIGVSNFPNNFLLKAMSGILWQFVILSILLNQFSKRDLIICFILLFVVFAIYFHSKVLAPFYNMLAIIAARHKDFRKILEGHLLGTLCASILVIGSCYLGVIPDTVFLDGSKSLGFFNPNAFPTRLAIMVFSAVYIWYRQVKIRHLLFINAISFFVYVETGSRAGLIIILGFTFFVFFTKISKSFKFLLRKFCVFVSVMIALFSILGIALYAISPFFQKMDVILTGRLSQPLYYFAIYQPTLLGNYIKEFQIAGERPKLYTIDNGYARVLIEWGIIYFFCMFIPYWKTIRLNANHRDYAAILVLIFILLYMLSESVFCSVNINWFIILCAECYFVRHNHPRRHKTL